MADQNRNLKLTVPKRNFKRFNSVIRKPEHHKRHYINGKHMGNKVHFDHPVLNRIKSSNKFGGRRASGRHTNRNKQDIDLEYTSKDNITYDWIQSIIADGKEILKVVKEEVNIKQGDLNTSSTKEKSAETILKTYVDDLLENMEEISEDENLQSETEDIEIIEEVSAGEEELDENNDDSHDINIDNYNIVNDDENSSQEVEYRTDTSFNNYNETFRDSINDSEANQGDSDSSNPDEADIDIAEIEDVKEEENIDDIVIDGHINATLKSERNESGKESQPDIEGEEKDDDNNRYGDQYSSYIQPLFNLEADTSPDEEYSSNENPHSDNNDENNDMGNDIKGMDNNVDQEHLYSEENYDLKPEIYNNHQNDDDLLQNVINQDTWAENIDISLQDQSTSEHNETSSDKDVSDEESELAIISEGEYTFKNGDVSFDNNFKIDHVHGLTEELDVNKTKDIILNGNDDDNIDNDMDINSTNIESDFNLPDNIFNIQNIASTVLKMQEENINNVEDPIAGSIDDEEENKKESDSRFNDPENTVYEAASQSEQEDAIVLNEKDKVVEQTLLVETVSDINENQTFDDINSTMLNETAYFSVDEDNSKLIVDAYGEKTNDEIKSKKYQIVLTGSVYSSTSYEDNREVLQSQNEYLPAFSENPFSEDDDGNLQSDILSETLKALDKIKLDKKKFDESSLHQEESVALAGDNITESALDNEVSAERQVIVTNIDDPGSIREITKDNNDVKEEIHIDLEGPVTTDLKEDLAMSINENNHVEANVDSYISVEKNDALDIKEDMELDDKEEIINKPLILYKNSNNMKENNMEKELAANSSLVMDYEYDIRTSFMDSNIGQQTEQTMSDTAHDIKTESVNHFPQMDIDINEMHTLEENIFDTANNIELNVSGDVLIANAGHNEKPEVNNYNSNDLELNQQLVETTEYGFTETKVTEDARQGSHDNNITHEELVNSINENADSEIPTVLDNRELPIYSDEVEKRSASQPSSSDYVVNTDNTDRLESLDNSTNSSFPKKVLKAPINAFQYLLTNLKSMTSAVPAFVKTIDMIDAIDSETILDDNEELSENEAQLCETSEKVVIDEKDIVNELRECGGTKTTDSLNNIKNTDFKSNVDSVSNLSYEIPKHHDEVETIDRDNSQTDFKDLEEDLGYKESNFVKPLINQTIVEDPSLKKIHSEDQKKESLVFEDRQNIIAYMSKLKQLTQTIEHKISSNSDMESELSMKDNGDGINASSISYFEAKNPDTSEFEISNSTNLNIKDDSGIEIRNRKQLSKISEELPSELSRIQNHKIEVEIDDSTIPVNDDDLNDNHGELDIDYDIKSTETDARDDSEDVVNGEANINTNSSEETLLSESAINNNSKKVKNESTGGVVVEEPVKTHNDNYDTLIVPENFEEPQKQEEEINTEKNSSEEIKNITEKEESKKIQPALPSRSSKRSKRELRSRKRNVDSPDTAAPPSKKTRRRKSTKQKQISQAAPTSNKGKRSRRRK
ncbi:hypothetical protein TPHA_0G01360 [Tetrapisispora phaffii CBS 4417]|uniref:Uncharacterized protein n=1 Tax=Tetrapisispora phaffii (strain ATCC 24235 / CBS 4417 / NBRC 1672 / NRRL Y-8282 / UCD 70-5) TaxID=1071381 RepID=G8BVP5_TETPH|nr:hypothetical protein TPHA_0G01360 [Tetrapisispora phaffii CBS 4417]CCE63973.1 hypothetical protein TPHA_0G01360 [Tetrapisispora phaffii CBS 4417]